MASIFGSPPFLTKTHLISSSSQKPPPSPSPPSSQPPSPQVISTTSSLEQQSATVKPIIKPAAPASSSSSSSSSSSTSVESTDWIASNLSRRFGLGAGLAWAAFLAVGVISEQVKTRLELSQQEANTRNVEKEEEVVLPNGIRYYELRVGGGASPRAGDLVVIDLKGKVEDSGQVFVDTFGGEKKPLALVMGSRPYTKGMCEGIEYVLRSMKAGGKRRVIIPPSLGFGDKGADFGSALHILPSATLEYILQVDKVSIAPA